MLLLFDHYWEDQFWRSRLFYMEDPGSWCRDLHCCPGWPLHGGDALTCWHLAVLHSQSPCFSGSHHSPWILSVLRLIVVRCPGSDMHPGGLTRGSNGHDTVAEKSFRILQSSYPCRLSWISSHNLESWEVVGLWSQALKPIRWRRAHKVVTGNFLLIGSLVCL